MRSFVKFGAEFGICVLLLSVASVAGAQNRVGNINRDDVDRMETRIESKDFNSFFFGPAMSTKVGDDKSLYTLSLGRHWETTPYAEIRGSFHGAFNSDGQFILAGLGASYLALTTDISPVLGAELGFGYINGKADGETTSVGGFGGGVHAGMRFFRLSSTQMEVTAYYKTVFAKDSPGITGISLGVLY